jgi:addiction module HigA family antidote
MSIRRDDLDAGRVDLADVIDKRRASMRPCPPGDVLRTEFLKPIKQSAYGLAKDINVPLNRVAGILAGKRAITADAALRLARYFGTDAQSWINLQGRYDLEMTRQASGRRIDHEVKPRAA